MSMAEVWQTSPQIPVVPVAESMRSAAMTNGRSIASQLNDIVRLSFAPGKLQPDEYFAFRLYDSSLDDAARRRFVGRRLEQQLHRLTCDTDWWVVAHDKLLAYSLLGSLGFPVPQTKAIYREGVQFPGIQSLKDREALAAALRGGIDGPLFGKPVRGIRSTGVLSIDGYDPSTDQLRLAHGRAIAVEEALDAIATYSSEGYLLQERICQHPDVTALCGETVATVRAIVLLTEAGPKLHRALWKVPAGSSVADNFWRDGNMLADLDAAKGKVTRLTAGVGAERQEIETHPTSGKPIRGFALPDWTALCELVLAAATALPETRMQAWDIALTANGPLLVEVNNGGDYNLPQLASGQGMLDDEFLAFLKSCADARGMQASLKRMKLAR